MKLIRFGAEGQERPGMIDADGEIRDLSAVVDDWSNSTLDPAFIESLATSPRSDAPVVRESVRLGPCVAGTRNFLGVGLNYADHAAETNMQVPAEPVLFNKAVSSIAGANDDLRWPHGASDLDWEIELAFVIGRRAYCVAEQDALSHIAGFCICNDYSERQWQLEGTGQWLKGKSAPGFGPLGPWLVTADELPNLDQLELNLSVNGAVKQSGSTEHMVFRPAFLVSYVSQLMALEPGDVITTGTPAGVGVGRDPKEFLRVGDVVEASITGLGSQHTRIVSGSDT